MSTERKLGKIKSCTYGGGGYQDAMFGIQFDLGGSGWGVGDFWGAWGHDIECTQHCRWTEQDRLESHGKTALRISKLLSDAKKRHIGDLVGVPIEVEFEAMTLKSWRVLTEVV